MNGLSGVCLMQDVVWFMYGLFIDGVCPALLPRRTTQEGGGELGYI